MKAKAHRIVGLGGVGLVIAVMLAGPAQAAERPDDRGGLLGVGGAQAVTAVPDAVDRAVQRYAGAAAAVPDAFERAAARGATPMPDALDRAVLRETASGQPSVAPASDGGFEWGDALFGAAATLLAVMLACAAALTIRHRGRVILP
jgi:hypothetical protein